MSQTSGKCPNCDTENAYTSAFCSLCGDRLPWADALTNKTTEQERLAGRINTTADKTKELSQDFVKQMTTVTDEDKKVAKLFGNCIAWIVIGLCALCGIGFIISLLSSK